MRAVLQRVSRAAVVVDGRPVARIGHGLLVLAAAGAGDADADVEYVARKTAELRIFEDDRGKMNRSVEDVGGEVLVVSQFTLYADSRSGRRPSFDGAMEPEGARALIDGLCDALASRGLRVQRGHFGALMEVELVNHGPVTLLLDSRPVI